jgi:hypothetical protein
VNYDTLATYALQRFYSALDTGRVLTAFGVLRSFAVAFEETDVVTDLDEALVNFKRVNGVDLIDVISLGLFRVDCELEFGSRHKKVKKSGYDIYKALYRFQMKLQELFDKALIGSMKQAGGTEGSFDTDSVLSNLKQSLGKRESAE